MKYHIGIIAIHLFVQLERKERHMESLRKEARDYYDNLLIDYYEKKNFRHPVESLLDEYDHAHPGLNAYQLKAAQYRILSEKLTLKVFDNSPFYFATDLKPGCSDGHPSVNAGGWLFRRNQHLFRDANPADFDSFNAQIAKKIHLCCGPYIDAMHYCYPINNIVSSGFESIYQKTHAALSRCVTQDEHDFIQSALDGLIAIKHISERFAGIAKERLNVLRDPKQRKFMQMIADSASVTPWKKPRHFYEGLNILWFCRDLCGPFDGIGNSHLGRPDYVLRDLYNADITSGYITKEEAYELICQFILLGDCHYNKDNILDDKAGAYGNHELEMGYVLGGCDENGHEVYNDITRMFIRAHRELKAVYPKVHYRFSTSSSIEYLEDISYDYLHGRSIAGLSNDDSIIPALIQTGKTLEDARGYINYGCWGVVIEGKECISGGNYHHLLTMLDLSAHGGSDEYEKIGIHIKPFTDCGSFEEIYQYYLDNVLRMTRQRAQWIGKYGKIGTKVNPLSVFSVCLTGCIENRKDYYSGGAKYNDSEIDLSEFANAVDGLLAIKTLCFDEAEISLPDFLDVVRNNWADHEDLRQKVLRCPHYGDESAESVMLSRRLFDDIYNGTRDLICERGGQYYLDAYVYREFRIMAEKTRATPDGRRDGDLFAMGICPTRYHQDYSLPAMINSLHALDAGLKSVNHSITIQLPAGKMDTELMVSLLRVLSSKDTKHIQINCVDKNTLLDAKIHPELHQDLVVRVCGFSAKFIALSHEWQDEFISRIAS